MPLYTHGPYDNEKRRLVLAPEVQHSLLIYRDIEDEIDHFCRAVPPVKEHFGVYSTKLWGIILRACAEIDSQLHALVEEIEGKSVNTNIANYISCEPSFQLAAFSLLTKFEPDTFTPFQSFSASASPTWWKDYNAVKHRRLDSLKNATLENAINAVGGLYIVLLRQHGEYLIPRRLTLVNGQQVAESPSGFFSVVKTPWH